MTRQVAKTAAPNPPATDATDADRGQDTSPPETPTPVTAANRVALLVRDLGWSEEEAIDTHFRLRPFEEDWDAPGMDAYDDL